MDSFITRSAAASIQFYKR